MPRESQAERRQRAGRIARALARAYPDARIALRFENPFELLIATILSAQCTDERVNRVTQDLFARYPTPAALAGADPAEVERLVKSTGFFRQKARSIQSAAGDLEARFGGAVPDRLEDLVTLRGVARKTANVVLGGAFGKAGIAVDTHVKRVSQRLGLTREDDPDAIERELMELLPAKDWTDWTIRVIHHGRVCCEARRPRCETCPLAGECPYPRGKASPGRGARPARA